mgnify:CR=1 FL=1
MIDKKVTRYLCFSLLFTAFLPVGVFLIIFGATKSSILLTIGIILAVLGFYGCPMLWVKYGEMKTYQNACNQITRNNIQTIEELATINNQKPEDALKAVQYLIAQGYLLGYEIVGGKYIVPKDKKVLSKNELLEKEGYVKTGVCLGCGAPIEMIGDAKPKCLYCGRRYDQKQ